MKSVLKNRSFVFIGTSQFIHKIGECLYDLLMPLLVLYLTGSPVLMGTMYVVGELAEFIVYMFGGVIVDMYNRKKLLITIAVLQATLIILIPVTERLDFLNISLIFLVSFILDICVCLYGIADVSIIPQIVEKEDLPSANGFMQVALSTGQALGPAISGGIISIFGLFGSVWINSGIFLLLLFTFLFLQSYNKKPKIEKITPKRILSNSWEGFLFTYRQSFLRKLLIWPIMFGVVIISRLISLFIQSTTDPELLGRVNGASRLISGVLAPVSVLLAGYISEIKGTTSVFIGSAAVIFLSAILIMFSELRQASWGTISHEKKVKPKRASESR
ncbi:Transmembrane secretion effector [Marininema mesophilum]|uniref:Transmembrane secretion effector n=1 Tax=Marininema mesophilum TaxID=1048340 RepID=A0A1H3BIW5_9BACL|nr:MFS transporter [Marininema mesophilum]SDX41892.1 Transmembrane secretion effector [Marininema mesophilum]